MRRIVVISGLLFVLGAGEGTAQEGMHILNWTTRSIVQVYFSPVGREAWGKNQIPRGEALRPQGRAPFAVDHRSGRYSVKIVDATAHGCLIKSVVVRAGDSITLNENDLTNCTPEASADSSMAGEPQPATPRG